MVKSLEGIISVNQETLIFGKLLIIESLSNILETKFLEYFKSKPSGSKVAEISNVRCFKAKFKRYDFLKFAWLQQLVSGSL